MSVHVFFSMSVGLERAVHVPRGTLAAIGEHVARVEKLLHLQRVPPYSPNPERPLAGTYWRTDFAGVSDATLCETADSHNAWVRRLYDDLTAWSLWDPAVELTEELTPEHADSFWPALVLLEVPPARWTSDYYLREMRHLYEVLRGRPDEGVELDAKALSAKQAGAVIGLFEKYLQRGNHDLEVILGQDHLASRELGEYAWCPKCGAVDPDSPCSHIRAERRAEEQ